MNGKKLNLTKIVFIGMLAAVVCVVTLYRFPLLGSKVHFANAICLLSGLLMGPVAGGLAASSRVREPRRTALPRSSQSQVLWG